MFAGPKGMQILEEEILAGQFVLVVCAELDTTRSGQQFFQCHASHLDHFHTVTKM